MRRITRCGTTMAAVMALAVGFGACGSGGSDGATASAGARFLVLPESTPGLVVAEATAPEEGYGSGALRSEAGGGTGTVAMVRPGTAAGFDAVTAGAASATLSDGLTVFYACGGRSTSGGAEGSPGTETVTGPLMVLARVDGGFLSVEDVPTDTGSCTQPTSVEGPLVDVAASLQWVGEAEFRRLVDLYPAPERTTPPATG